MTERGATKSDEFTCEQCHGTFPKGWSDEEAAAEADELWGDDLGADPAVVCDDCFEQMNAAFPIAEYRGSVTQAMDELKIAMDQWEASLTPAELAKHRFHSFLSTQIMLYGKVDMDEAGRLLTDAVLASLSEKPSKEL